jgi:hypothetical protein
MFVDDFLQYDSQDAHLKANQQALPQLKNWHIF